MDDIYGAESLIESILVTGAIGGAAAFLAGRAIARTWRPLWQVILYMLLLGAGIRFVHFALFEADLFSPIGYAIDTTFLVVVACLSWRATRATQMVTQYAWLYERSGPLTWRARRSE